MLEYDKTNYLYITLLYFLLSILPKFDRPYHRFIRLRYYFACPSVAGPKCNVITLFPSVSMQLWLVHLTDVDSASFNFILRDTNNSGGSMNIGLLTPAGCTLGATDIDDGDVYFLLNSSAYANGSILTINEGTTYSAQIRFSGSGNYGNAAGLVTCSTTGTLTYTY